MHVISKGFKIKIFAFNQPEKLETCMRIYIFVYLYIEKLYHYDPGSKLKAARLGANDT